MKTLTQLPVFTKPDRGLRGWTTGTTQFGPTVRALHKHKAPHRQWPDDPFPSLPRMYPVISNRLFTRWVRTNWTLALSPTDRSNWAAQATGVTIINYKGLSKTPNGYQLYSYFENAWKPFWYFAGKPFDPSTANPDTTPYTPWTPPPAPFNITVTAVTARGFSYEFDGLAGFAYRTPVMGTMIALPTKRLSPPFTKRIVDIFSSATAPFPWAGHYLGTADWSNIFPIPPRPGDYTARIRYLTNVFPWTPSDWATFIVTVP
jgi:hypothetical protein